MLCKSIAPGSVMQNRTMLWSPSSEGFVSDGLSDENRVEKRIFRQRGNFHDDKESTIPRMNVYQLQHRNRRKEKATAPSDDSISFATDDLFGAGCCERSVNENGDLKIIPECDEENSEALQDNADDSGRVSLNQFEGSQKKIFMPLPSSIRENAFASSNSGSTAISSFHGNKTKLRRQGIIESLEYSILQSYEMQRNHNIPCKWDDHKGKVEFEVFSQQGMVSGKRHIGTVSIAIKDLIDRKRGGGGPKGPQKIRRGSYNITPPQSTQAIGKLKVQIQLELPPNDEFKEIDRLRQYELENVMRPPTKGLVEKYRTYVKGLVDLKKVCLSNFFSQALH